MQIRITCRDCRRTKRAIKPDYVSHESRFILCVKIKCICTNKLKINTHVLNVDLVDMFKFVVIGGGIAGVACAETVRFDLFNRRCNTKTSPTVTQCFDIVMH